MKKLFLMKNLIESAKSVLKENDRGKMTIPSSKLYPHMWAWDSVFAAMGWAHIDMNRAEAELAYQLDSAWDNGMIPHIVFDKNHLKDYFPGPDIWGHGSSTTITQPPVWAIGLDYLLDKGLQSDRMMEYLTQLEKTHLFFYKHRDPEHLNLVAISHPWESGMDNSPAWDLPLKAVSSESRFELNRVDVKKVENPDERPSDLEYKKYLRLVQDLRSNEFSPTEFLTYDPFMSTVLYLSELALDKMAKKFGFETKALQRANAIKSSLMNFFDPQTGRFLYRDSLKKENYTSPTLASLFPVLIEELDPQIRDRALQTLKEEHLTEFGLTTYSKADKKFDDVCYWRGPVWINTNFFFWNLFPEELYASVKNLITQQGFREYYSPTDGSGLGATNFSWTAALFLVMNKERL